MSIQKVRRSVLVAAGVVALAVSGLFAGRLFGRQMGPGGFAHTPRPAHMFDRVARELDLSDAQRAQIRAILKVHSEEILAQVKAGMDARHALHSAVVAQPTDETAIRALGQQTGAVHAEGALLFAKIRAEVWPVLTAEQQQRFMAFHAKMAQRGEGELQALDAFLRGES